MELDEIEKIIRDYFDEEMKEYRFKSQDDEEEIYVLIDEMVEDVRAVINSELDRITCQMNDNSLRVYDQDIIELDKYRI